MPSFTSNSERPFRVLLAAVLLAATLAAGWDVFWRHRGFAPSVVDDVNLWSLWRRQADADGHVIVLAGSSRFMMDLHLQTLRSRFPGKRVVQLSINGGSPLSVLQDLADDAGFRGQVICEVLPHMTYTNLPWKKGWDGYRNLPWSQRIEGPLHVYLSTQTNLFLPDISLTNVGRQLAKYRRLPAPGFLSFDRDRQGRMNFARVPAAELTAMQASLRESYTAVGVALTGADFERRVAAVRGLAETIRGRGGRVLFVRMISSPPVREVENSRFPDGAYWDVFRRAVGFPCLNSAENPDLGRFVCPEGTHLDQVDAPAFTAILSDVIERQCLLN